MTTAKNSSRRRFDADLVVGARLRLMRNLLGRSQADVAAALGLTFQQLQNTKKPAIASVPAGFSSLP